MLKVRNYILGMVSTNVYIVSNEESGEAVIIDAAANATKLKKIIEEQLKVQPKAILLTHGHFDHIMAVEELAAQYGIPVYAGEKERELLGNADENLSAQFQTSICLTKFQGVKDGDVLEFLGTNWKVLETPGHTEGSVCYYVENAGQPLLFSGDTLFCESMGRTDFPTGSQGKLLKSIAEKLLILPEETLVYPGHEESTTIAHEKQYNPASIIARLG